MYFRKKDNVLKFTLENAKWNDTVDKTQDKDILTQDKDILLFPKMNKVH